MQQHMTFQCVNYLRDIQRIDKLSFDKSLGLRHCHRKRDASPTVIRGTFATGGRL